MVIQSSQLAHLIRMVFGSVNERKAFVRLASASSGILQKTHVFSKFTPNSRWRFTRERRAFILKEDVGDVATGADPIHASLPWAGIRLLLKVKVLSPRFQFPNLTFQSTSCDIWLSFLEDL